jgi:hypothetical protein
MTRCDSCRAPVLLLRNQRTRQLVPIDAAPARDGFILPDRVHGTYRTLTADEKLAATAEGVALHTNHRRTCPGEPKAIITHAAEASTP